MHIDIVTAINQAPLNRGLDGASWIADPNNIPVLFENGDIALFDYEEPGVYQVHFLFQSRGKEAIQHAKDSFATMFVEHWTKLIFGLVPNFRRDVKLLARWAGGKSAGIRNTVDGPCELFVLSSDMWKGAVR